MLTVYHVAVASLVALLITHYATFAYAFTDNNRETAWGIVFMLISPWMMIFSAIGLVHIHYIQNRRLKSIEYDVIM